MSAEKRVHLAHGNGGRRMRELIDTVIGRHLAHPALDTAVDAARLGAVAGELVVTTDGFTVNPLEFPGGTIGSLAVHGTLNDLAVAGAQPLFLTLNLFIEEGFDLERLDRILASLGEAARSAGVPVVAGDTKVVARGEGGGLYLSTTGIGVLPPQLDLGMGKIQAGDRLLVSGPVGDHGVAVMLAREQFGLQGDVLSDAAWVGPLTRAIRQLPGLRFMRDPTRGGLATVAHDIWRVTGLSVRLYEGSVPVREAVRSVCEILGFDPYYLACEGRVVAVAAPDQAQALLDCWRAHPQGKEAAIIGEIRDDAQAVVLQTELGGERQLDELDDEPLPRIC